LATLPDFVDPDEAVVSSWCGLESLGIGMVSLDVPHPNEININIEPTCTQNYTNMNKI